MAKVYGRFKPDTEERDRWEKIASERDAEKWARRGAKGASKRTREAETEHKENLVTQGGWDHRSFAVVLRARAGKLRQGIRQRCSENGAPPAPCSLASSKLGSHI